MGNRQEPSRTMGCVSGVLGFLSLYAATFLWPVRHQPLLTPPSLIEKWFPATVLFVVCASVVALVLAFNALLRRKPARGWAVVGALMVIGVILVTIVRSRGEAAWRRQHIPTVCSSNVRQLALAHMLYSEEWNGRLPPASDWVAALDPYTRNTDIFLCPADRRRQRQTSGEVETSYTMNELCDGRDIAAFDALGDIVLMFDGTALYGRGEVAAFRHNDRLNVSFADGHCKMLVDKSSFEQLRWEP